MAGRIPQSFIDDVVERVDIVDVVGQRVKLKKAGKNYSGLCPFHNEKTPSFSVNPQKQFYYCFGCGAGGNSLKFLLEHDRMPFPEAVEALARLAGMEVPRDHDPAAEKRQRAAKAAQDVVQAAADFYRQQLRGHARGEQAIEYLKSRGLTGVIAQRFGLGYAPPGWSNLLDAMGKEDSGRLQQLVSNGLVIAREDGRVYDRFRDRIMFPIRDARGRPIAFGGRTMGDGKPKYLNSPETPVFQKGRELYGLYEALQVRQKLERLLVVEGYMDVIALHQFGLPWAVATLGTATSAEHLTKMFRWVSEIVFCFDGDDAGRQAAVRALNTALPEATDGRTFRFLFLPEGEDPDTLVRSVGADGFQRLISEAPTLTEFMVRHWREQVDMSTLDGRARLVHIALPQLVQLPDQGMLRSLVVKRLAEEAGVDVDLIQRQIAAAEKPKNDLPAAGSNSPPMPEPPPLEERPWADDEAPSEADFDEPLPAPRRPRAGDLHQTRQPPPWQQAMALLLCWPALATRVNLEHRVFNTGDHNEWVRRMLHWLQEEPVSSRYEAMDLLGPHGFTELLRALSRTEFFAILTRDGDHAGEAHIKQLQRLLHNLTHEPSAQEEYQALRQRWLEDRHSMTDEQKQRYLALLKLGKTNPM